MFEWEISDWERSVNVYEQGVCGAGVPGIPGKAGKEEMSERKGVM